MDMPTPHRGTPRCGVGRCEYMIGLFGFLFLRRGEAGLEAVLPTQVADLVRSGPALWSLCRLLQSRGGGAGDESQILRWPGLSTNYTLLGRRA